MCKPGIRGSSVGWVKVDEERHRSFIGRSQDSPKASAGADGKGDVSNGRAGLVSSSIARTRRAHERAQKELQRDYYS
jgi:hypothetical protein